MHRAGCATRSTAADTRDVVVDVGQVGNGFLTEDNLKPTHLRALLRCRREVSRYDQRLRRAGRSVAGRRASAGHASWWRSDARRPPYVAAATRARHRAEPRWWTRTHQPRHSRG